MPSSARAGDRPAEQLIPLVDTHVHFFDLSEQHLAYEWLQPGAPPDPDFGDYGAVKSSRYWPEDFEAETRFSGLAGVIHVEAPGGTADPVAETRWVTAHATASGLPQAVVAHVDLAQPDAAAVIEEQLTAGPVRGIRDLRDDDYLDSPSWRRGYSLLVRHELVCCAHPALSDAAKAVKLARDYSTVTLCLDHFSYPQQRDAAYFRLWREAMTELAGCGNVVMKLSGLGMNDHRWTLDSIRPWIRAAIELFGTNRCFFGSNWPIDRLFSSYTDLTTAFRACIQDLSPDEQQALLYRNAQRIFRLPVPPVAHSQTGAAVTG